jgi:thiosulfate reductase cytochrome b subunit
MVCHAALEAEHDHEILPRAKATRSCEACHAADSALIEKYAPSDDRQSWVTNPVLFERAYVPGAVRNRLADRIVLAIFALTVVGAVSHGLLRALGGALRKTVPFEVHSSRLYPVGLRLWHWANAVLVILLAATGFRLHFGGRERPLLTFEEAFNIHNVAGAILVVVGLAFFVRNIVVRDTRQYLGKPEDGIKGLLRQVGFYLLGIFRGADHPYHATPERRFNPLQKVTYAGVMYVVFPVLVGTGIVLLFPHVLPERLGGRPAVWWFATAHYLSAVAMVAFLLGHIYLATTGDRVRYHFVAMITGLHRRHVRKDK